MGTGTADPAAILDAVWASLHPFNKRAAERVKRSKTETLNTQILTLTIAERQPGLSADHMRLVALAKKALTGADPAPFWEQHLKLEGLI